MASTEYLKRRGQTWSVRVQIPPRLWAAAGGRREYVHSLRTRDLNDANNRKHALVAEFKRRIRALAQGRTDPDWDDLSQRAIDWRQAIERPESRMQPSPDGTPETLADFYRSEAMDDAQRVLEEHGDEAAAAFHRAVLSATVNELLDPWLLEQVGQITQQTVAQHRAAVKAFMAWAGQSVTVLEVDRRKAGQYVTALLGGGLSRKTVRRRISSLSSLWQWLEARGHPAGNSNPWSRPKLNSSKRGEAPLRRQWQDEDLLKLLTGSASSRYSTTLHDLVRLALVTGARIEELCALETQDLEEREDGWWLKIRAGKTEAAVRQIPVHGSAAHVLERRRNSPNEFVFPSLVPGGPDRRRSWNVVKAFGVYRKRLGLNGAGQVFHSLRNTFMEAMEAAEVPESTTKLIVGHKRQSLTYGGYSRGGRVDLREAIDKLTFSEAVMNAIELHEKGEATGDAPTHERKGTAPLP